MRKAIECAQQITAGLSAAHEKGVTHRDLKPENLFVTAIGPVKILDFGLAKLTSPMLTGSVSTGCANTDDWVCRNEFELGEQRTASEHHSFALPHNLENRRGRYG